MMQKVLCTWLALGLICSVACSRNRLLDSNAAFNDAAVAETSDAQEGRAEDFVAIEPAHGTGVVSQTPSVAPEGPGADGTAAEITARETNPFMVPTSEVLAADWRYAISFADTPGGAEAAWHDTSDPRPPGDGDIQVILSELEDDPALEQTAVVSDAEDIFSEDVVADSSSSWIDDLDFEQAYPISDMVPIDNRYPLASADPVAMTPLWEVADVASLVDDMKFNPAPAALSLLALGGCLIVRRRFRRDA